MAMRVFVLLVVLSGAAGAQSEDLAEISNVALAVKSWDSGVYVVTVGEIKNKSDATLEDISLEARYFNSDGQLVDAAVENLYSLEIPPNETIAFRIESLAVGDADEYASQGIRLISASKDRPCGQMQASAGSADRGSTQLFKKLLISSFPILLLIAVWIFFMQKFGGKNSPQNRSLDLIQRQNEIVDQQNDALKRIADAVESIKDKGRG